MKGGISILIADDHAITRMGLVSLLETEDDISVVGQASNGNEAITLALALKPDVVIMDLMMPETDGVTATRRIHAALPDVRIMILTTFGDTDDIAHALDAGATGALMKSSDIPDLVKAIRSVASGRTYIAPEIAKMLSESPPLPTLTKRQQEILTAVTKGLTNSEMSERFGITPDCVKDHMKAILSKLGASSRAEAVALALRKHLLKI